MDAPELGTEEYERGRREERREVVRWLDSQRAAADKITRTVVGDLYEYAARLIEKGKHRRWPTNPRR